MSAFGNPVSMSDYEHLGGFGILDGGPETVADLQKALSAGVDNPPTTGGGALRVESLEATLRVVTFSQQNLKFWRGVPKLPAFNTVEEYNILNAYGNEGGAWTNEGDLPETQDSDYERKTALIKFMGTVGEITHPMLMVKPAHGNVQALETQNKATYLLEQLERSLFNARSDVIAQEPDGLAKQIFDGEGITTPWDTDPTGAGITQIIDLRGAALTEDDIEDGATKVTEAYGAPTDLYGYPSVFKELSKAQYGNKRYNLPPASVLGPEGRIGFAATEQQTNAGLVQFQNDVFIRPGRRDGVTTAPTSATSTRAPSAPASVTPAAPGADPLSKFEVADAGTYIYQVTAFNRFGESTATTSAGAAITAGDSVAVTWVDGGGADPAQGYRVYRTAAGGAAATAEFVIEVPSTVLTYTDRNYYLQGTGKVFLVQRNLQNMSVRQLAPMLKIPLATVAASIRWMQLMYLTLVLYSPRKNVMYINVAK